jgi:hypothetical protein
MSFLNPLLWFGLLALAAPIWLHLRRRRERNLVRFSAVCFLDESPKARRSPLRLRDWGLLALRALALLLIVGAFAWPFWKKASAVPIQESRVYILDNSLSHQARDGFDQARERILRDMERAGAQVQIAVMELNATPRVVSGFGDDRGTAREKVRALRPSFSRGSYLAAFRQANQLLEHSLGERRRIVLLGDSQANQWSEAADSPPFLHAADVELPKVDPASLPNLGLAEPRLQRVFAGDKSVVSFTAKLSHSGPAETAAVTLRANRQTVFRRVIELAGQPETILLRAQWEADATNWVRGEAIVEAEPDVLAGDNRAFYALAPLTEGKVDLLAQSPYLRLALSREVMRGQWKTRLLEPNRLGAELAARLEADVLCLESSFLQSSEARQLVTRFLNAGKGVFLLIDKTTPTALGFLRELGFEAEPGPVRGSGRPEKFQFVFSEHPIFRPFLSPDFGNLLDIEVHQHAGLRAKGGMPLVISDTGNGLFFQGPQSPGKLLVMAFGLNREQTSWPVHPTFIPFLDLALRAARAEDAVPNLFEPGEVATLRLSPSEEVREATLSHEGQVVNRFASDQGQLRFRVPDQPGLYQLTYDDRSKVERVLAVNTSAKESQLTYVPALSLPDTWRLKEDAGSRERRVRATLAQARLSIALQQRVWWWMLLGGLLVAMAETTLAERRREGA